MSQHPSSSLKKQKTRLRYNDCGRTRDTQNALSAFPPAGAMTPRPSKKTSLLMLKWNSLYSVSVAQGTFDLTSPLSSSMLENIFLAFSLSLAC